MWQRQNCESGEGKKVTGTQAREIPAKSNTGSSCPLSEADF